MFLLAVVCKTFRARGLEALGWLWKSAFEALGWFLNVV
jgi:hypothetical protein